MLRDGEAARLLRKEVGAIGFDSRRRSLRSRSLSLTGEGESSMINTQPDSPESFLACLSRLSLLFLESGLGRPDSQLVLAVEWLDADDELLGTRLETEDELLGTLETLELMLLRPVMLAMRSRGTRVWIFCSRFRTRARISETICTPLFLDTVLVVDPLANELELVEVRTGVARAGRRAAVEVEGLYKEPVVVDRENPVVRSALRGLSRLYMPDRWSEDLLRVLFLGVEI